MIDTEALRKKIIELAIQGKLTQQLPEDGNAEDLYAQIQEEKAKLIKAGKIKREIPFSEISDDEIPFEIPSNWKWMRLIDIAVIINGDRGKNYPAKSSLSRSGTIPFISALNLNGKSVSEDENLLYLSEKQYDALGSGKLIKNDIVVCIRGSLGKHGRYPYDTGAIASSLVICRAFCFPNEMGDYIMRWLDSSMFPKEIDKYDGGSAQPSLAAENLKKFLIPIPPIEEQKRIVEKLNDILAQIDNIDALQQQYEFDCELLKGKIIDAGIRGKLTEQLPEDGNAEDLYTKIQEEKTKLIREGRIKKEKPFPEITDDEIPFEMPLQWKCVHLGDVADVLGGKRIPAGRRLTTEDTGHKYIRVSEMKNRSVVTDGLLFVPNDIYPSIARYIIKKEDVYITVAGTIGKVGKIPEELDGANLTENADRIVFSYMSQEWLIYCLSSTVVQKQINVLTTQVAQPKLALKRIKEFILPLPPLAEQIRVANRIDELLKAIA